MKALKLAQYFHIWYVARTSYKQDLEHMLPQLFDIFIDIRKLTCQTCQFSFLYKTPSILNRNSNKPSMIILRLYQCDARCTFMWNNMCQLNVYLNRLFFLYYRYILRNIYRMLINSDRLINHFWTHQN